MQNLSKLTASTRVTNYNLNGLKVQKKHSKANVIHNHLLDCFLNNHNDR